MKNSILSALRPTPLLAALALGSPLALADGWCHLSPWESSLPGVSLFGTEVAMADGWAFVASKYDGVVQVYRRDGGSFVPTQLLTGPAGAFASDGFGTALELEGERLFVGAGRADGQFVDQGRVHVFELFGDQWLETATITSPDAGAEDHFGQSVSADGDWLAISTQEEIDETFETRVFVYRWQDGVWESIHTIEAPNSGIYAAELALRARGDGQTADLFLGLPGTPGAGEQSSVGVVRHFRLTPLAAFAGPTLAPGSLEQSDLFGCAIDFDGEQLFVGAQNVDGLGFQDGAVFVYDVVDGLFAPAIQLAQVLVPGALGENSKFGDALVVGPERLVVGARFADEGSASICGAVHTFLRDAQGSWMPEERMVTAAPEFADYLGASLAVDGELVLAGAHGHGDPTASGLSEGAAFLFSLTSKTIPGGQAPVDALATAETYGSNAMLDLAADTPPVPGEATALILSDGPVFGMAFLAFGQATTELELLGGKLLVDPLVVLPILSLESNGYGGAFFLVPDDPALYGRELYVQAAALDPFAEDLTVELSNGLRLVIGF